MKRNMSGRATTDESIEDELDLKEALKVLEQIKNGETDLVTWENAKKYLDL